MNPQQSFIDPIVEAIKPYGIAGIIFLILLIILAVLWILLPLAVYPLHGAMQRANRQLQMLNRKIDQLAQNQREKKEP